MKDHWPAWDGFQVASCNGTKTFQTPQLAWMALSRKKQRGKDRRSAYRCHFCGHFHLGWMPKPGSSRLFDED